jgi:hypothetical protein
MTKITTNTARHVGMHKRQLGVVFSLLGDAKLIVPSGATLTVTFSGVEVSRTVVLEPELEPAIVAVVNEHKGATLGWRAFRKALEERGADLTRSVEANRRA